MYTVELLDIDHFRNSQSEWNELVLKMKRPCVFCTWEWIFTWWKHFGNVYELIILFIRKDSKLIAIFPLTARNMQIDNFKLPMRVIAFCGSNELSPDHLDIICAENEPPELFEAIYRFFLRTYTMWDVIYLPNVLEDSMVMKFRNESDRRFDIERESVSPYISLVGSFDDYMRTFSKKHRHNRIRLRDRLYEKFNVKFCMLSNTAIEDLRENLKDLFRLHQARKETTSTQSSFAIEAVENFHNDLAKKFQNSGWLRLASLRENGRAIAIGYSFAFGNVFNYYQTGFDPEWEKHSIGSTLILELIENAFKEGFFEFDFLRGRITKRNGAKRQDLFIA